MIGLVLKRAEMLCLERDLFRAKKAHGISEPIRKRLVRVKAQVAALEVRYANSSE